MRIPIGKIWRTLKKVVAIAPVVVKGIDWIINSVKKDKKNAS